MRGAEYWLTVDIGKVQTLTGIRNKCYASSYSPTAVEVFTSGDGIKWKSIGTVTISRRDRKSTRLNSSHKVQSRMPSSA